MEMYEFLVPSEAPKNKQKQNADKTCYPKNQGKYQNGIENAKEKL